jgi:hypothetical protein
LFWERGEKMTFKEISEVINVIGLTVILAVLGWIVFVLSLYLIEEES